MSSFFRFIKSGKGKRRWLWSGMALLVILSLTIAGCAVDDEVADDELPPPDEDVILIGGIGPLSMPGAVQAGLEMQWAIETAAQDVNEAGGVLGKQIEIVFADTQNQPDVAASMAEKLVTEDQVVAVVGEYHSGSALAMIPIFNEAAIPVIFAETWADAITGGDPDNPNLPPNPPTIFRIAPTSSYVGSLLTDWLIEGINVNKVVEIYEATDFGLSQHNANKEELEAAGIEIASVQVELMQEDYSAIVGRLAEEHRDADALLITVTGESSYIVAQNVFEVGLTDIVQVDQVAEDYEAFWRAVPDGAGACFISIGLPPAEYNEMTRSVAERFNEEFGGSPKSWVLEAYDSLRLIADAIERAGTTESEAVVAALENTSFVGAQGQYEFPYNSTNPVPEGEPSWLWHQWPNPPAQIMQYTEKGQSLAEAAVIWPEARQTEGKAFIQPE